MKKKEPVKTHGWEGTKSGKPPFPGAAMPIHLRKNTLVVKPKGGKK